ncbi:DMT family transporter [Acuticoccus mangrovi]|uniref:DMT family transporter n=1 Tax=Acuticoccus mangrovi TaxID=2796142 RepID=A0A934MFT9_9HYPH|nr:DMT family transporter [Acuticoccus mangrovi]MBJ3775285.1 DMT family transporter [Acuticoccus mangrovi]
MLVALSVLWGASFIFSEVMLAALPVLTLVTLRVAIAAVILWGLVLASGTPVPRRPGTIAALAAMGLLNNALPFSLIVWGQTSITAGLAAILNATTPLFTAGLAGIFLADERLTRRRVGGLLLGLAGVAVMVGPDALSRLGSDLLAQGAVLAAAFSYGCAVVFGRRFKRLGIAPMMVATGQTSAAALILAPFALILDRPFSLPMPGAGVWLAVVANAAFATAFAYILYFAILARSGATNVVLVTVLVPVVAVLVGAVALGETVSTGQLAGMALICAGLAVIDGRLLGWLRVDPSGARRSL